MGSGESGEKNEGKMFLGERRRHPRVSLVTKVTHIVSDTFHYYYSRDLSLGGIFLETRKPFPPGTRLHLEFSLPHTMERIHAEGEVKRVVEPDLESRDLVPGMGIAFVQLAEESASALKSFLLGLQEQGEN